MAASKDLLPVLQTQSDPSTRPQAASLRMTLKGRCLYFFILVGSDAMPHSGRRSLQTYLNLNEISFPPGQPKSNQSIFAHRRKSSFVCRRWRHISHRPSGGISRAEGTYRKALRQNRRALYRVARKATYIHSILYPFPRTVHTIRTPKGFSSFARRWHTYTSTLFPPPPARQAANASRDTTSPRCSSRQR